MMSDLLGRTIDGISQRLERRQFLKRSTMVASAVVAAPAVFALRPGSAYAAVCRCQGSACPCGSLCCDGYTEMCCTLTGSNSCPAGTVVAGWWKVDGSQFCGGQARYYMDCNAQCGTCGGSGGTCDGRCSGTPCGCANGSCSNRKAGCTRFRYGQCHQNIPLLGPIVCRVVTCAPPWTIDPACGTSARTDNNTRTHNRECLTEPFGSVDGASVDGADLVVSGWAIPQDGGSAGCDAVISVDLRDVARVPSMDGRPDVGAAYPAFGANRGFSARVPLNYGPHLICVRAIDRANGRQKFLGVTTALVPSPFGALDEVVATGPGQIRLMGWGIDPVDRSAPAVVRITVDGSVVAELSAGSERPDIGASVPGAGSAHGLVADLAVAPGIHDVCAEIVGRRGGSFPLGCRQVTVS